MAWGSWGGVEDEARRRRRRCETIRRLEALEDRRLLAASIAIDAASLLTYEGDAVTPEVVSVSLTGSTYRFTSNNDIDVVLNVPGLTITHPGGDPKIVDVEGITGIALVMNTTGGDVTVGALEVPTTVYDTVPEVNYTLDQFPGTHQATITAGENSALTGDVQSLRISSPEISPDFAYVIANKTNVVFNQALSSDSYSVTVNYGLATPVAGLENLTVSQGDGDDSAALTDLPPGATTVLSQGEGNDSASLSIPGTAGTIATTVDGGPGTDVLTIDADGLAISAANFYVNPGGSVSIRGAILPGGEVTYSNYESVVVNDVAAVAPTEVVAAPIEAVQGVRLVDALIGTFTASTATAVASNFGATIAWGDGSQSAGTIVQDASDPSVFYVYGTHTYTGPDSPLTTTLTVAAPTSSTTTLIGSSPVTFNSPFASATAEGEATITATALDALVPTVYGVPVHGVEGQALTNVLVGAFTSSATATAADFVATVAWGDGTTTTGTIVQDASNPSVYYVYGSHTYYNPGQGLTTTITVRSLANTFQELEDGSPVTFFRPAGDPVSLSSQAFIDDAPIDVAVGAASGFENIAIASADLIVATFADQGGIDPMEVDPAAGYTATVYWGDGSAGVVGTVQRIGTTSRFLVTAAPHTYATPGSYPVTVVVAQAGEPTLGIGSNFAVIADAPLNQTASQPTLANATEGVRIVDVQVASFVDANPLATTDQYTVTIDWGDGAGPQAARVVQPGGVGTTFYVVGSHTYASSIPAGGVPTIFGPGVGPYAALSPNGNYAINVAVKDTYGSAVNLYNTITVLDRALTVSGALTSASDTGISNADGVTKDSTPTFAGVTSEGNATVWVYASLNGGAATAIGSTTSDSSGAWSFTPAAALADGGYTIQAQAYDAGGHTISAAAPLASGLVIDTVGPKITDVVFDNIRGQVVTTFQDYGGVSNVGVGLASSTIRDANNYRFVKSSQPLRRWLATSITVSPDTTTGAQVATVAFNGGQGIRGGRYSYRVLSVDPSNLSGVQDIAGNALDGEFYGYFPSGNNVNGGDFAAYLDAIHRTIYPASSQVGTATPVSPPGTAATGRTIGRGGVLLPSASSAVRLSAASRTLTTARAARLAALAR